MTMNDFNEYVMGTYNRLNVSFSYGDGVYLFDSDNNRWMDMISGIGVVNLGHSNPKIVRTLKKQAALLWHTSNLFLIEKQYKVAKYISELSFKGKTFFCNSGAEANEAALKLARRWGKKFSDTKNRIISLKNSFHGRTLGSLTLTGQQVYQQGFEPLLPGIEYIEPNNIDELRAKFNSDVCGIFIEVIQGEGGVLPLNKDFVKEVRRLSGKYNALFIVDEVQTGIGRTGKIFAYKHFGIEPDVITLAKGLGNGIPIGVMHAKDDVAVLNPGEHASTFGGNHLVTAVAYEVLRIVSKKAFLRRVLEIGDYFISGLKKIQDSYPAIIKQVRGIGLMIGIETDYAKNIFDIMFENKIIVSNIKNKVIRLLPPLIIGKDDIDYFLNIFADSIKRRVNDEIG
ncbi:MAG TPA: aspartate aminotransferase family protein [Spirochaetota bacterium]|nr:aspartate aminotransferase family protein [Spirochaetota bacterium]HOM37546.1 aspartate aminotransferase family protein [Spirochaetota bacterium]HPQ49482.1 aspartate aminotransferase family protein [Spirochaetota bacterium]